MPRPGPPALRPEVLCVAGDILHLHQQLWYTLLAYNCNFPCHLPSLAASSQITSGWVQGTLLVRLQHAMMGLDSAANMQEETGRGQAGRGSPWSSHQRPNLPRAFCTFWTQACTCTLHAPATHKCLSESPNLLHSMHAVLQHPCLGFLGETALTV